MTTKNATCELCGHEGVIDDGRSWPIPAGAVRMSDLTPVDLDALPADDEQPSIEREGFACVDRIACSARERQSAK